MPWDLLIRGGQIVTPQGVAPLDIAIEGERIVELKAGLRGGAKVELDATGQHIFPGVIDPHVHFNEPGRTEWEGWATGSAALAAGGGTCCFEMPLNANPPTLDGTSFDLKRAAAEASSRVDFALWGGLTPSSLESLDEMADRGVVGFKAFMSGSGIAEFGRADEDTLRRGMTVAARRGLIVAVHAESEAITAGLTQKALNAGRKTWRDYLESRPISAEVEAIERAIALASETGCDLHIVHVSSSAGIAVVNAAQRREKSIRITSETCPHYLLLNEANLIEQGASAKCAPPVRPETERLALVEDLAAGRIEVVASDHSPAPASMKIGDDAFAIWGGIAGVQSTLPALLTINLSPTQASMLTSVNVAERFRIAGKGKIEVGSDADLALIDVGARYPLSPDMLLDRHKLTPYVGRLFTGLVKRTIVRGQTVFLDGRTVGESRGRLVTPGRRAS